MAQQKEGVVRVEWTHAQVTGVMMMANLFRESGALTLMPLGGHAAHAIDELVAQIIKQHPEWIQEKKEGE